MEDDIVRVEAGYDDGVAHVAFALVEDAAVDEDADEPAILEEFFHVGETRLLLYEGDFG